jgi:molecular chaperone IbpA
MQPYDLSPLFRSGIGFEHLSQLLDSAFKMEERGTAYPPYNIAKVTDDDYEITMAVAGFKQSEISITAQNNTLKVTGSAAEKSEKDGRAYLHRGIANRSFERIFSLADHVKVVDATLADGLLTLKLVREVPEASKPRSIPINSSALIEGKTKKAA